MTSPLHGSTTGNAGSASHARGRTRLARKWAYIISSTAYLPYSSQEIDQAMREMVDAIFAAAMTEPFTPEQVTGVGARLVEMRCTGPLSLRRTVDVIGKALLTEPELRRIDGKQEERAIGVLGVLTADYLEAARQFVFTQQEDLKEALLRASNDVHRQLRTSEARFDAVFSSSPNGVAVVDLAGNFMRVNESMEVMLDRAPADFVKLTLFDVVDPDEAPFLRAACKDLAEGWMERLHQQRRLVRSDGEAVRASLTLTLLRNSMSKPHQLLVTVHDETEISLLQGQLSHQSLHDVLTGLPNRQYFSTRLETVLRQANPDIGATLYLLDLDAFGMITDGLGRHVGDRVLMNVAQRLKAVVAGENAMVSRFDSDEFAIVVQNSDTTPDIVQTIAMINEELAEPIYIDGHGVAASASIGVVHQPPEDSDVTELLRTADMTLRRAKVNGRRQWGLFDKDADALDRSRFSLTAEMPGALEMGEITVMCRPLTRLSDSALFGFEAMLHWQHGDAVVEHEDVLDLAENTGLVLPLRDTLLHDAAEQVRWWNERNRPVRLVLDMTANQSCDPDLVGAVLNILAETGLDPSMLRMAMPTSVLIANRGEAVDNLKLLVDNGIGMAVHDFGSAAGDIECLEDLPVTCTRIARRLVDRQWSGKSTLIGQTLKDLVKVAHMAGASVTADGVDTAEQESWWRETGADYALGTHYGVPADLRKLS